jgi:hypothetical protein
LVGVASPSPLLTTGRMREFKQDVARPTPFDVPATVVLTRETVCFFSEAEVSFAMISSFRTAGVKNRDGLS